MKISVCDLGKEGGGSCPSPPLFPPIYFPFLRFLNFFFVGRTKYLGAFDPLLCRRSTISEANQRRRKNWALHHLWNGTLLKKKNVCIFPKHLSFGNFFFHNKSINTNSNLFLKKIHIVPGCFKIINMFTLFCNYHYFE